MKKRGAKGAKALTEEQVCTQPTRTLHKHVYECSVAARAQIFVWLTLPEWRLRAPKRRAITGR